MARHRVLLVREWDEQLSSSGCCGRLDSATAHTLHDRCDDPYARARTQMEIMGEVYRRLRDRHSEAHLELTVVDPRNMVWLLPTIWRDARRRGLPVGAALRQLNAATANCAVVCDGKVLTTATDPARAVAAVEADLAR